jgi:hypothetical protein
MSDLKQAVFLPWAGQLNLKSPDRPADGNTIRVGPVTLCPFSELKKTFTIDPVINEHLDSLFSRHVTPMGDPVGDVFLCLHGEPDFRVLSDDEWADLVFVVNALVFATIFPAQLIFCSERDGTHQPSADALEMVSRRFKLGEEGITVDDGFVSASYSSHNRITFQRPFAAQVGVLRPDIGVLRAFDGVLRGEFTVEQRKRIKRSLDWFRFAHGASARMPHATRVVMMMTAFEILLGLKNASKYEFATVVRDRIPPSGMRFATRIGKTKNGEKPFSRSFPEWWAVDYYDLRSRIVHGQEMHDPDFMHGTSRLPFLEIADVVFGEILIRELYRKNCYGTELRNIAENLARDFPGREVEEWEEEQLGIHFHLDRLHRGLDWVAPTRIAPCGNACSECPRHIATASEDPEQLAEVAGLWFFLGFRDDIISNDEIACRGCTSSNPCCDGIVGCAEAKRVMNCGSCSEFSGCTKIAVSLARTDEVAAWCRGMCSDEEYLALDRAFFRKRENLARCGTL